MIPVLVKQLTGSPEVYTKCYNCGSNIFRVIRTWGIVDSEYAEKYFYPRVCIVKIGIECAACGKQNIGYELVPHENVIEEFDSMLDAKIAEGLLFYKHSNEQFVKELQKTIEEYNRRKRSCTNE